MARRRHNTQTTRDRQKLVADFERRLRYNEEQGDFRSWLRRPNSLAWVVHPAADETELLAELDMRPEECRHADAYWRYRDSVYFVQMHGNQSSWRPSPHGLYYRFDTRHRQDEFKVFLPRPVVTSADFDWIFARLERLIDAGAVETARAGLEDRGGDARWMLRKEPLADFA